MYDLLIPNSHTLTIFLSIYPSIYLSICLSIYLSIPGRIGFIQLGLHFAQLAALCVDRGARHGDSGGDARQLKLHLLFEFVHVSSETLDLISLQTAKDCYISLSFSLSLSLYIYIYIMKLHLLFEFVHISGETLDLISLRKAEDCHI